MTLADVTRLEPSQGRYLQPGQQVVVVHHDGVFLEVVGAGGRTKLGTHFVRRDKGGIRRRRGYRYDEVRPRHGRVIPRRIGLVRVGGGTPGFSGASLTRPPLSSEVMFDSQYGARRVVKW